jgi:hypothetical protein
VTWNFWEVKGVRKVAFRKPGYEVMRGIIPLSSGAVGPPTSATYHKFYDAMRCNSCNVDIAARQCAACSSLLCLACALRCDWDLAHLYPELDDFQAASASDFDQCDPVRCAFALCPGCSVGSAIRGDLPAPRRGDVLALEVVGPYLSKPICDDCTPSNHMFCPAHVDFCILECSGCEYSYCVYNGHNYQGFPQIDLCQRCNRGTCINQARTASCEEAAGLSMNWCNACAMGSCSDCTSDFTSACPACGESAGYSFH